MSDNQSFEEQLHALINSVPQSWGTRRPQPEWDRDFTGSADALAQFKGQTEKARDWVAFGLKFSEVICGGYEGLEEVRKTGRETLQTYGPKGQKQFED